MSAKGSSNKKIDEDKANNDSNDDDDDDDGLSSIPESPTLATRYAHRAATLVHSIEKKQKGDGSGY
jgi:hypothetical protein